MIPRAPRAVTASLSNVVGVPCELPASSTASISVISVVYTFVV